MAKFTVGQTVKGNTEMRPGYMGVERRHVGHLGVIVHVQQPIYGTPFYKLEYPSGAIDWADECTLEAV